ncbi:MAG: hypothetical protein GWN62_36550 [Aliifodinibius sp.]|nr:hypothetical protein [Fodinibius sp.]
MFDRICIPPKYPEQTYFDLGLLAESLIFYREVIIIVRYASLKGLLSQCNNEVLVRLLQKGRLKVKYLNNLFGAISQYENTPLAQYDIGFISARKHKLFNASQKIFQDITGKKGKGRRLGNRFANLVEEISYAPNIASQIREELFEGKYISDYITNRIIKKNKHIDPSISKNIVFKFGNLVNKGYSVETNIDLDYISKLIKDDNLKNPSTILSNYGTTIADLSLWSQYDTEVAIDDNHSDVLKSRFNLIYEKRESSKENLSKFQDFIFEDSKAIRESINCGKHKFEDIEPILDKSEKFSNWLQCKDPDKDLLKEYFREVTADSWIDKLPSKFTRWAIFTGLGLGIDILGGGGIGTLSGISISALDSFLIDKILKGWKPNHFIEKELRKFVS